MPYSPRIFHDDGLHTIKGFLEVNEVDFFWPLVLKAHVNDAPEGKDLFTT